MPGKITGQIILETTENENVVDGSRHGFTKAKSWLSILDIFCKGVVVLVDEEEVTNIIYLDSCRESDTILHIIFASKLERHGFDGLISQGRRNLLDGYAQNL